MFPALYILLSICRIHGMKSGKALKEFRGHSSYVYDAHFSADGNHVITASHDGSVRIWSAKSAECQHTFKPFLPNQGIAEEIPVLAVHINPKNPDQFVVCNRTNSMIFMNIQAQPIKTITSGKREKGEMTCSVVSPRGGKSSKNITKNNFNSEISTVVFS